MTETSTLFRLPHPVGGTPSNWSDEFSRLAPLLPVFARRIRKLVCAGEPYTWSGSVLAAPCSPRIEAGSLPPRHGWPRRALVVRCGEAGDVLFGLTAEGFVPLPGDIPSVWVTAPTAERHELGYVVNGRELPVDIGRSQVAWGSPETVACLRKLADATADALVALFDAGVGGMGVSADAAAVWRSFWEVVRSQGSRRELRENLMWGEGGAALRLFRERRALPTGLACDGYSDPTSLADVRGSVSGLMDRHPALFALVAGWGSFRAAYPPGSLVLDSAVGRYLPVQPARVGLVDAVRSELEEPRVEPPRATVFGRTITRDRLNHWHDRDGEIDRLRGVLQLARFRTDRGGWADPSGLVAGTVGGDESLRAAFAPPDRRLHSDYEGAAADFFLACRPQLQADADTLVEWVLAARTREGQDAALRYLSRGELGRQVLRSLHSCRPRWTWLNDLPPERMREAGLDDFEQVQLSAATAPAAPPLPAPAATPPVPPATEVFARIARWWEHNQTAQLALYYGRIYPDGRRPAVSHHGLAAGGTARQEWLKLLVTGVMQTLGRVRPQQTREFLRLSERNGWFAVLSDRANGPRNWLAEVEQYVDNPRNQTDRIRYFHWLRHFVGVETIARHLDAYVESFLSVDRFDGPFAPSDLLTSRGSRQFQFGGPDAPTLSPILGIGSCFVLRELVRSGVVTRDDVFPYCYPPARRLRRRLEPLGWRDEGGTPADRSRSVHEFIRDRHDGDPTFCGSFDIPLLMCPDECFTLPSASRDGDFITLWDGRVVPRR